LEIKLKDLGLNKRRKKLRAKKPQTKSPLLDIKKPILAKIQKWKYEKHPIQDGENHIQNKQVYLLFSRHCV